MNKEPRTSTRRLRVLFVNRMAAMQRGGGETFDLEMAAQMARMGHEVTVLAGWPVFGRRPEAVDRRPETEDQRPKTEIRDQKSEVGSQLSIGQSSTNQERPLLPSTFDLEPSTLAPGLKSQVSSLRSLIYLRSPYLPWFPWDRVKGGWRVRVWEFQQFERKAAKWIEAHQDEFDIIQICELPYLVYRLKVEGLRLKVEGEEKTVEGEEGVRCSVFGVRGREERNVQHSTFNAQRSSGESSDAGSNLERSTKNGKLLQPSTLPVRRSLSEGGNLEPLTAVLTPKLVLRLTAPNAYDAWGGIQLADAVIASGTSIEKVRKQLRPDVVDVPNGVDIERFKVEGCRLKVREGGLKTRDLRLETKDHGLSIQHPTFNTQHSSEDEDNILEPSTLPGRRSLSEGGNLEPLTKHQAPSTKHEFRQKHHIPPSVPVLLYVARFQDFKNHRLLLDAFARVLKEFPEARLVLAGSGPLMKEMEVGVRRSEAGKRVIFLGETPFDQLPEVYAASDVKVISSDYESFCFAAIEAMASGLPVVTTDCGWVPRLLGDPLPPVERQWFAGDDPPERFGVKGSGEQIREAPGGLIVGRNDPGSLAAAILRMLASPELALRCGAWNRKKAVREHGWESSAKKLLGLYERLTGK